MNVGKLKTKDIVVLGLLIALNVVMAELMKIKIIPNILELSFGFLPLALTGMLFGAIPAMIVGVVGDCLGALIFYPAYFNPAYTLTALLTGLFYGLFLHREPMTRKNTILAQALVSVVCYAFLNSLWAFIWYHIPVQTFLIRMAAQVITFPIYLLILFLMQKYRKPLESALRT